jgi:hypothetical protein
MSFKLRIIFAFLMSSIMGAFMALVMTLSTKGITPDFIKYFLTAYRNGFSAGFPSSFVVAPTAYKITDYLLSKVKHPSNIKRRMIFAVVMAGMMDFIIAMVFTISVFGFPSNFIILFLKSYFNGWIFSLPIVFFIGPIMLKLAGKIASLVEKK